MKHKPSLPLRGKYFVYVGNAYPHKNLERLVKAMVLLNNGRKEKILLKISSSRSVFIERLEKLIKSSKAENYVQLLGFVSDVKIGELYKNAVAFVFPTLDEGFGLPPKEAITSGTIAVVSNIPVLKEVYKDSVDYFDPMKIESIVKALGKVLRVDIGERKRKITYAQKFLKRYSWEKMAEETLKIYESIS